MENLEGKMIETRTGSVSRGDNIIQALQKIFGKENVILSKAKDGQIWIVGIIGSDGALVDDLQIYVNGCFACEIRDGKIEWKTAETTILGDYAILDGGKPIEITIMKEIRESVQHDISISDIKMVMGKNSVPIKLEKVEVKATIEPGGIISCPLERFKGSKMPKENGIYLAMLDALKISYSVPPDTPLAFVHHEYTAQPILLERLPIQEIMLQRWGAQRHDVLHSPMISDGITEFGKMRRMRSIFGEEADSAFHARQNNVKPFFDAIIEENTPLAISEKPFIMAEKPFAYEEKEKEGRKEKRNETIKEICETPSEKTKGEAKEKREIEGWAKEKSEIFMWEKARAPETAEKQAKNPRKNEYEIKTAFLSGKNAACAIGETFGEKKEESRTSGRRKGDEVKNYFGKKGGEDEKGGSSGGKMKVDERKKGRDYGEEKDAGKRMKPKNGMIERNAAKERKKENEKKERKENGKKVRKDKENEGKAAKERRKKAEKKNSREKEEKKDRKSANAASQKNKFKAILLDMDGVVALSENFHRKTFNDVLKSLGIFVNKKEWMKKYAGIGSPKIMKRLFRQHGIDEDAAEWVKKRAEHFKKALQREKMPSVPGVKKFLKWAKQNRVKVMVVSGGHSKSVSNMLKNMGISGLKVVGRDNVKKPKPSPDEYLLAAKKLGVSPSECLVFEDSPTGVRSARGAGMKCVALLTTNRKKRLQKAGFFIRDFRDGRLVKIISLLFGKNYQPYS